MWALLMILLVLFGPSLVMIVYYEIEDIRFRRRARAIFDRHLKELEETRRRRKEEQCSHS